MQQVIFMHRIKKPPTEKLSMPTLYLPERIEEQYGKKEHAHEDS